MKQPQYEYSCSPKEKSRPQKDIGKTKKHMKLLVTWLGNEARKSCKFYPHILYLT